MQLTLSFPERGEHDVAVVTAGMLISARWDIPAGPYAPVFSTPRAPRFLLHRTTPFEKGETSIAPKPVNRERPILRFSVQRHWPTSLDHPSYSES
jgi:hypothetical protein